mmetsp:Transcript_35723/g.43110  ORF Transcript_35723/g.43110 Transcript_35723/m.43110 type:complete len:511 (-) Transcript_35723:857-2389(-)|eukprot:CAMPEP_0197848494 /NCGR_PEP_ID=MMETSP1438-20131217/8912_1 /TAXON_ID=1461541 /ORGANISM="Pterosperma sp., Strain CCMP1384" /LENGTH=510 /DNA_ID=CAMNT_0043460769 /DNA_START=167 /DNA_END=1699 /DNA_ORIENTATION=+
MEGGREQNTLEEHQARTRTGGSAASVGTSNSSINDLQDIRMVTTSSLRSPTKDKYSDRYIPSRRSSNLHGYPWLENPPPVPSSSNTPDREEYNPAYNNLLRCSVLGEAAVGGHPISPHKHGFGGDHSPRPPFSPVRTPGRIFSFNTSSDRRPGSANSTESPYSLSPVGGDGPLGTTLASPRRTPRKIARAPFKVLDAPALQDDFYLNLVDWSTNNTLAVGLGSCVYLWSACTSKVTKLCDLQPDDTVCSVAWTQRGTYLAVGTNQGDVQIWDAATLRRTRTMGGNRSRVGTLAWSSHMLSSGSRDRTILQRDVRTSRDYVSKLLGHKSEVCGLKWSTDDRELASGGNDNHLLIWNASSTSPVLRFAEHTAAVKAISWSPHQTGLLASGGGTADRCIRFWNTSTNSCLGSWDTGSQVCNLVWSKNVNELVSTHGYSQNQIIVWKYPNMSKLATLTGHTLRVLYLAISPDGQTIVTGAGDETLRFWNVFPGPKSQGSVHDDSIRSRPGTGIR